MKTETQYNEYISLDSVQPRVNDDGLFFPVKAEHVNLDQYGGDARSFGYHFDDGLCTIVTYEQVVGVLADDTIALLKECMQIRKSQKKPDKGVLEKTKGGSFSTSKSTSELLIRYGKDYFYKDDFGYWFAGEIFDSSYSYRVTDESGEIYRTQNKVYQASVKKHNELMKQALENIESLKKTL